jgi:hypothetical protein
LAKKRQQRKEAMSNKKTKRLRADAPEYMKMAWPFLEIFYESREPWDAEWERAYQKWLDAMEAEGFELAKGMR